MKPCSLHYANDSSQEKSIWNNMINYYYDHIRFEYDIPLYLWLDETFKARVDGANLVFEDEKYMNWFLLKFQ